MIIGGNQLHPVFSRADTDHGNGSIRLLAKGGLPCSRGLLEDAK
jgi:hypothetical protein